MESMPRLEATDARAEAEDEVLPPNLHRSRLLLRICAVLIALRALTNLLKPWSTGTGLVFFGKLLSGTPNLVLAPAVGIYMLVLAWALWRPRPLARPMALAYTGYVAINLALFPVLQDIPESFGPLLYLIYAIGALGILMATVWLLSRQQ
jgi:hypothetical protein